MKMEILKYRYELRNEEEVVCKYGNDFLCKLYNSMETYFEREMRIEKKKGGWYSDIVINVENKPFTLKITSKWYSTLRLELLI